HALHACMFTRNLERKRPNRPVPMAGPGLLLGVAHDTAGAFSVDRRDRFRLGGGGIRGGSIIGSTTPDGREVADHPVSTPDLLATICMALGIDPQKQNISN